MTGSKRSRRSGPGVAGGVLACVLALSGLSGANAEEGEGGVVHERPPRVERWRNATPAERRAMRAEFRQRWEDASPRERRRAGRRLRALERALPEFSPIERLALVRAVAALPEEERKALRKRLRGIDALEPPARRAFVDELRERIRGQEAEIERFRRNRDRWEGMSEAERREAREQMKKLRAMSVEERRALLRKMEAAKGR